MTAVRKPLHRSRGSAILTVSDGHKGNPGYFAPAYRLFMIPGKLRLDCATSRDVSINGEKSTTRFRRLLEGFLRNETSRFIET